MSPLTVLLLLMGAAGVYLAALFYVREDAPSRGRTLLMSARLASFGILVLLLLDLRIPGGDGGEGTDRWLLADADLSLLVPSAEGPGTLRDDLLREAEAFAGEGGRLALASPEGRGPEGTDPSSLPLREPDHPPGDLVDGIQRLAEAGADSVVVVSTLRQPAGFLEGLGELLEVPVRLHRLGGEVVNAGIGSLDLPGRHPSDRPLEGRVTIFGEGGEPGDTVRVTILGHPEGESAEVLLELDLPLPPAGSEAGTDLLLPPPPAGAAWVRYLARVERDGDVFPLDDERARWMEVGEPDVGIFLVSLRPDWEPRYLLPALRSATGLDGEGYLALADGRFLTLAEAGEPSRVVGPEAFLERAGRSRIVVLHGVGGEAPDEIRALAAEHPRLLLLPDGPALLRELGVEVGDPLEGEWVPDAELPPSPLAPFLAGIPLAGLPPLGAVLPLDEGTLAGGVVLRLRRTQAGEPLPGLVLLEPGGRRVAVAPAVGYWRWGSRTGPSREAYRGLWGGVADWLLAGARARVVAVLEPVDRVQPRGAPLRWHLPPGELPGELELRTEPGGTVAWTGPLAPGEEGVGTTPPLPPGLYRYRAGPAEGIVEVEGWAPSLRFPPLEVEGDGILPAAGGARPVAAAGGRPLRTHPIPYLLIVALLCAEWFGRRRLGLR